MPQSPSSRRISVSKKIGRFAGHPMCVTLVGFLLTGIGGAVFTTWLQNGARDRDLLAASQTHGIEAIHEIIDLINERRTRSVMLRYAIKRNSPVEAEARKASYDDVYVRWNTKEQGIRLRIQEFIGNVAPDDYKSYILSVTTALTSTYGQTSLNPAPDHSRDPGLLTQMDTCVTNAYDDYRATQFKATDTAEQTLVKCGFDHLDDQLIDCTTALADSLYGIIGDLGDSSAARRRVHQDAQGVHDRCLPPPPPT
jgi:hypothetical protein